MARPLSVFVNIGAKLLPSLGTATNATVRSFERMGRRINVIGAEMRASMRGIDEAASRARGRLFDGLAVGYTGARIVKPFVAFEDALVRMGNTAEVYGPQLERVGAQIIKSGAQFGYGGSEAAAGASDFLAAGLDLKTALDALAPTLMLSRTAGVEVMEASQAGIAVLQNLGLSANQLGAAFNLMAKAGKEGRFEINDMARAFPGLSSRASILGMTGLDAVRRMAAMLQITRMNARDAEEAENNLLNFFDKLTGNETLQHFEKMGVSIKKIMEKSKRDGTDFVDTMLDEIGRLTKDGTDAIAMTKLFPDRQARQAAMILVQQRKELERIKKALGSGAKGVLEGDFGRISVTSRFGLQKTMAGLERIGIALGRAFGPMIGDLTERFAGFAERFAGWAERNPGIIRGIGALVGGFAALRIATAGFGLIFGGVMKNLVKQFGGRIFASLARGLVGLGPVLLNGLVALAPWVIRGIALLFTPAGWIAALVGVGALLVWYFRDDIAKAWGQLVNWFKTAGWPEIITTSLLAIVGFPGLLVDRIIQGLANAWPRLKSWFSERWNGMMPSFMSIGVGGVSTPASAGNIPGRAHGGSVSAGRPYLVGERGPELLFPSRSGAVATNERTQALLGVRNQRGGDTYNVTVNAAPGADARSIAREVQAALKRMAASQSALLTD